MVYSEIFNSLQEFSNVINSRPMNEVFVQNGTKGSEDGSKEFTGTKNYEEAENLLRYGDREKLEKLQKVDARGIKSNAKESKLQIEKKVCGCLPNIPLYLIGAPANMLNFKRRQYKSKIMDIVVNAGVNYRVTIDKIITASAKIASVVKALESNGIRVNLYVTDVTSSEKDYICALIKIKNAAAPLNMLNISYPLINPSMLRRHFFKFIETLPVNNISKRFPVTYGAPTSFDEILKRDKKTNQKFKNAIVIDLGKFLDCSTTDFLNIIKQAK